MLFCGLYSGCRLGHALALGIDTESYYKYKGNILVIPGQDLLDNLAWLLVKQNQYGCCADEKLKFLLEHKFNELFNEIYYDRESEYSSVSYLEYYNCWKLRGDNPDNYRLDGKEFMKRLKTEPAVKLQRYEFNPEVPDALRENSKYRELYMHYHYDTKVKKSGKREVKFKVPCGYAEVVRNIQDAMIKELVQKGIGIETNPSSNYLIGPIQKYKEHPIIHNNEFVIDSSAHDRNKKLLEEVKYDLEDNNKDLRKEKLMYSKILLSHNSSDKKYGDALRNLFINLGIKNNQLIYTSHPLNKIPFGENIFDYLKKNIQKDILVIYLWSNEYLKSAACLNEMGAAWIVGSDYLNIYTPDFDFNNPQYHNCAIDQKNMGIILKNDESCKIGMVELKNKLLQNFGISIKEQEWLYHIDEFMKTIE